MEKEFKIVDAPEMGRLSRSILRGKFFDLIEYQEKKPDKTLIRKTAALQFHPVIRDEVSDAYCMKLVDSKYQLHQIMEENGTGSVSFITHSVVNCFKLAMQRSYNAELKSIEENFPDYVKYNGFSDELRDELWFMIQFAFNEVYLTDHANVSYDSFGLARSNVSLLYYSDPMKYKCECVNKLVRSPSGVTITLQHSEYAEYGISPMGRNEFILKFPYAIVSHRVDRHKAYTLGIFDKMYSYTITRSAEKKEDEPVSILKRKSWNTFTMYVEDVDIVMSMISKEPLKLIVNGQHSTGDRTFFEMMAGNLTFGDNEKDCIEAFYRLFMKVAYRSTLHHICDEYLHVDFEYEPKEILYAGDEDGEPEETVFSYRRSRGYPNSISKREDYKTSDGPWEYWEPFPDYAGNVHSWISSMGDNPWNYLEDYIDLFCDSYMRLPEEGFTANITNAHIDKMLDHIADYNERLLTVLVCTFIAYRFGVDQLKYYQNTEPERKAFVWERERLYLVDSAMLVMKDDLDKARDAFFDYVHLFYNEKLDKYDLPYCVRGVDHNLDINDITDPEKSVNNHALIRAAYACLMHTVMC